MTPYSIIALLISFLFTIYVIPKWIYRAKRAGLTGRDLHKIHKDEIPEIGGLPVICGFLAGILAYIAFNVFVYDNTSFLHILLAGVVSILIAIMIGFVDDVLGWKIGLRQSQKALLTLAIAIPIMVVNAGSSSISLSFLGIVDIGLLYPLLLIPLGIMFTSNAFNMVAGYNGLEAGMGIIILSTLSYISYITGSPWVAMLGLTMVAALIAFFFYNWHPARLFPGDTLTYSVGALIGIMAVLANIEKYAIILFSLYILQFLLKARGLFQAESFAKFTGDGSLVRPYKKVYGIEHIAISLIKIFKKKAYETEVVILLFLMQTVISGLTLYYYFL